MSSHAKLLELLALPYNEKRDLEPYFSALKEFCRDCPGHPEKHRLHTSVYALYDIRYETDPPPRKSEARRYPYNSLPPSFWKR